MGQRFKDFYIAVGQPGAYSKDMEYTEVFGVNERFGIKIKHAPYSPMAKVKNMVVQSWKDEDGDDVWLPRKTSSTLTGGTYLPAITHEAVDYNPKFVIWGDAQVMNSNSAINELIKLIEGRWLKIWDEYTQMGFEGVYLVDVDDDPKFKRRNYDYVEFELKFRINGQNITAPFYEVQAKPQHMIINNDYVILRQLPVEEDYMLLDDLDLTPIDIDEEQGTPDVLIRDGYVAILEPEIDDDGYVSLADSGLTPLSDDLFADGNVAITGGFAVINDRIQIDNEYALLDERLLEAII